MEIKKNNKRYAICISGELRGNYELALDSIYKNCIRSMLIHVDRK